MFVLQGNIGAGKTTLLNRLHERFPDIRVVTEPVNEWMTLRDSGGSSIFQRFYETPDRYAFVFQMYVTLTRLNAILDDNNRYPTLYERSVETDKHVFMRTLEESKTGSEIEHAVYKMWFDKIKHVTSSELGTVYLRVQPEECHRRACERSRDNEGDGVTLKYLQDLHKAHDDMWLDQDRHNILVVDDNNDESLDRVYAFMKNISNIRTHFTT